MSGMTVRYTIEDREIEPVGGMAMVVVLLEQPLVPKPNLPDQPRQG